MKVLRSITALILVASILFTVFFVKDKLTIKEDVANVQYKGIITLWQLDSFEGGTGSRKQFLLKMARSFEKKNQGVLVMVINHTETSMLENLNKGLYPDMISFGGGAEVKGVSELSVCRTVSGGYIGESVYATAWCRGGYYLIANPLLVQNIPNQIQSLLVSQAQYTQPLTALLLSGITVDEIEVKKPMDAYVKFVSGKTPYFLGTQRDICRLINRGMEVITRPLAEFNDLYQYISVTSTDTQKNYYSQQFINHLLTDNVQGQLKNIGMFSPYISVTHESEHLNEMQNTQSKYTLSAFTDAKMLIEMQDISMQALKGNNESINKIKKLLI